MGSHIGYTNVIEHSSGGGWTTYEYTNFDNGHSDSAADGYLQISTTPYESCNSNAYKRGKLLSKKVFNSTGTILEKSEISYESVGLLANQVRAFKHKLTQLCDGQTDNRVYEGTAYTVNTMSYLPVEERFYTYDGSNPSNYTLSATITSYKSNGLVRNVYRTDSRTSKTKILLGSLGNVYNRMRVSTYTYADDLTDPVSTGMTSQHMVGPPLEINTRLAIAGSTDFDYMPLKWQKVHYSTQGATYLPSKVETRLGAASTPTTNIEFLTYDSRGNLLTYRAGDGVAQKREYYGTGSAGKVDLLWRHTPGDGSSIAQLSTYDHRPLTGIQSIQDANSKTLYYQYDAFGRLSEIRNTNSSGAIRAAYCYNYAGQTVPCTALAPTGSIAAATLVLIPDEKSPPLPVSLLDFRAEKTEESTLLSWSTAAEENNDRFEIMRSGDARTWQTIGSVAAAGENHRPASYRYTDRAPGRGLQFYRLKMIDKDGSFEHSPIRSVEFGGETVLYPNPVTVSGKLNLLIGDLSVIAGIRVYGAEGALKLTSKATRSVDIEGLAPGLYVVQVTYTDGSVTTHRIVKQ